MEKSLDENLLSLMLGKLNKQAYIKFIFELFSQHDFEENYEFQKSYFLRRDYSENIEQNYIYRTPNFYQGYKLIIPFFEPFDLFKNIESIQIEGASLKKLFTYYERKIKNRKSQWQFWTDGNFTEPQIKFITNYSGLREDIYENILVPKFQNFVNQFDLYNDVWVGSIDTFLLNNKAGTENAFINFINKFENELSISIIEDKIKIQSHFSEKYFNNGVLKNSISPCEPLISFNIHDPSQVIAEFEFLLNNNSKENGLEVFLKKYYKYIFGSKYDRIETQLWLKFPDLDISRKNRRLDVFLRNSTARDWELFELKRVKNIVKSTKDIPTFTSEVTSAIQQIRNYNKILTQDIVRKTLAQDGIEYYNPELRLVIGKTPDISIEQWRWLKKTNENDLKIITYDEIFTNLKSCLEFHNNHNLFIKQR